MSGCIYIFVVGWKVVRNCVSVVHSVGALSFFCCGRSERRNGGGR